MKKIWVVCALSFWVLVASVKAEIYHGIDIDDIYSKSDWSSKDNIKKAIDDYTLLLQYQDDFTQCSESTSASLTCYDTLSEGILNNFYVYPEANIKKYHQFKESLIEVYTAQDCNNKYLWPSGNLCDVKSNTNIRKMLNEYVQDLLDAAKEFMISYLPSLREYK